MLESIRLSRALAALLVVFFHAQDMINTRIVNDYYSIKFGAVGVDIFFAISGFIMMCTSYDRFGSSKASFEFLRNRAIRIIPTYYLFTTFIVIILLLSPSLFGSLRFELGHVIYSYLFILSENNVGKVGTVLGVGWTLTFEVFFYLILATMLKFQRKFFIPTLIFIFLTGNLLGNFIDFPYAWTTVLTSPIVFEFLFGCLIGIYYQKGKKLDLKTSILLMVVGIIWIFASSYVWIIKESLGYYRVFAFGLPSALFLLGAINFERNKKIDYPTLLKKIGDSSYSLYLIHSFIITFSGVFIAPKLYRIGVPIFMIIIISMSLAVIGGFICHYLFEKPVTQNLKRISVYKQTKNAEFANMV